VARHTAFEILYRDYYHRVFGLCRRLLGSGELAEDATQETFMRAYKSFGKFDVEQPFWQWIASIANNYCIDLLRKRSRSGHLFGDETTEFEALSSEDLPVLTELVAAEDASRLHLAIESLADKYRVPLVLAYFQQESYGAIAERIGATTNHVGVLLLRARQHLKTALDTKATEVPE